MEAELRDALAEDLDQLIRLHDRELDGEALAALRAADFPGGLALVADDAAATVAYANMAAALRETATLDELAADYAAIYLNNSFGASPYESVWLSDEHLVCDWPMFELREIYAASGWRAPNWRRRFDDHLVLQLQYLRQVLGNAVPQRRFLLGAVDLEKMANFIDQHIGYWLPDWAQRVSSHCDTRFYAALAELSYVWLRRFRGLLADMHDLPLPSRLADMHDLPLPSREQMAALISRKLALDKADVAPMRFMPGGQGPSW